MSIIKLRIPDSAEPLVLQLPIDTALLIGREPSAERLDPALRKELRGTSIREVTVISRRVSGNHLLVSRIDGAAKVWDLQSRNGTWLLLLPQYPITLPDEVDLTLELAGPAISTLLHVSPLEAAWTTESDYPAAVVKALGEWLQRSGVQAQVFTTLSGPGQHDGDDVDAIPVADGSQLHIAPPPTGTFEVPWRNIIDRARAYVNEENIRFEQLQGHDEDFILVSPLMREVHRQIVDAAAYGMRLMILGPTGSGKERLAACFHKHSRQNRGPYVTVNCALLKENLLYAQLFGAKKGSYTGAAQDMVGVVEAANEGTLFLDEIGEMDLEVQKALLRFLDSRGEYHRLGDTQSRRANVQVVCATNLALDSAEERRGKFREDLWYRLAVKVVHVPPLSQRPEDIRAFLTSRYLRGGQMRAIDALTPGALQMIVKDPWPGNFRDLENFVERLPAITLPGALDESACEAALHEGRGSVPSSASRSTGSLRVLGPVTSGVDWNEISRLAERAFKVDHKEPPQNWGQLQIYMEKYLKPVFIASSCGLTEIDELNRTINCSELARRLNIADGSTVKMHLLHYIELYRNHAAPAAP